MPSEAHCQADRGINAEFFEKILDRSVTILLDKNNIDTRKIYFNYDNKTWRIQLWKGDYGPSTGCEIGVYYRDDSVKQSDWYQCVDEDDMLMMSSYLKRDDEMLFSRSPVETWWLTGFRMDGGTDPSRLTFGMNITFKDRTMRDAFIESFNSVKDDSMQILYSYTDPNDQTVWIEWSN